MVMIEVSKEQYYAVLKHFDYTSSVGVSDSGVCARNYVKVRSKKGRRHQQGSLIGLEKDGKYYLEEWAINRQEAKNE